MSEEKSNRLKPWAQATAAGWVNASRATVISDMSRCAPASALSTTPRIGHWRLISYQAGDLTGNLLWASAEAAAPALSFALNVSGWWAIFVGLYTTRSAPCRVGLKLDGDLAPVPRSAIPKKGYWCIEEVFFKAAELKGRSLHVTASPPGPSGGSGLAYVKLVPLSDEEISGVLADRRDPSPRRLTASCDGFSFICDRAPTTAEAVLTDIEIFRDTDFKTLLLHVGGADQVSYPTKRGYSFGIDLNCFSDPGHRQFARAVKELARKNINPTRTLIDGAHAIGMDVHVGFRPAMWTYYPPYTEFFQSPFYRDHPQWRTIDRDGTPVTRMSWAVPEVRAHLIDVLAEAVGFGADGVHVVFNRGFPMVLWEPPFCRLFTQRHGIDPHDLDEHDPRITQLHCEIVATFLREVRGMLDDEARRRADGRRLALSACVLGTENDNLRYDVDIRRLVGEGLIDDVYVYKYNFGQTTREWDMRFFTDACRGTPTRVHPMFSVVELADGDIRDALSLYESAAAGLAFWDASESAGNMHVWSALSRFGHIDELRERLGLTPPSPVCLPVHQLNGETMDGRFPIFWGG